MIELKDVLEVRDFRKLVTTTSDLGFTLSRAEIEAVLVSNGVSLPLPHSVSYVLKDATNYFLIIYGKDLDVFAYERLSIA